VKINDQCTDPGYCDQLEGSNAVNLNTKYNKDVHFDLCNATGVTNQFFGQIGAGVATGYAQQLPDCSALDNGRFGSKLGTLNGGAADAGGVPASGALPGIALGALPISASGPEPSLSLNNLKQFGSQVDGAANGAKKAAAPDVAGGKQEDHVVAAGARRTTMASVVSNSTMQSSSSTGSVAAGDVAIASSSSISSSGSAAAGGIMVANSSLVGAQSTSAPMVIPAAQGKTLVTVLSSNAMPSSGSASPSPLSSGVAPSGSPGQDGDNENADEDCDEL